MEGQELTGYYTYRSFVYNPLSTSDPNGIKFVEAELFLIVQDDATASGTLSFPPEPEASERLFIDITGNVKNVSSLIFLELVGKGREETSISNYWYEFSCSVAHTWETGLGYRLALTGTVVVTYSRDSLGNQVKKNGTRTNLIAVKRDFPEPRDIPGVSIIPTALSMLASKSHRLKHAVWHTIRVRGIWYGLDEKSKIEIRNLGWGLDRPPFDENEDLNLRNGAGEDFLFMHRKMIAMMIEEYKSQSIPFIEAWKALPEADIPQFFYSEQDHPDLTDKKVYLLDVLKSGNMVPPTYLVPSENEEEDTAFFKRLTLLKNPEYLTYVMLRLERITKNRMFLATISLGALGNLIEFEIHNQMHMRWSSIPRDPRSGEPLERDSFDFDNKWDDPKYDYLGDFYSSHVNPIFWRLHGWVDDRIEDWFNAHEALHPGEIERYEYQGVQWFKPGKWVQVAKPLYWPEHHHHHDHHDTHSHGDDPAEIDNMLRIMEIIRINESRKKSVTKLMRHVVDSDLMSFMHEIKP
jgi:hypothetical protein